MCGMDLGELHTRAAREVDALGPEPHRRADFEVWAAQRHGAAVLLAAVAEWDARLLRRAAFDAVGELTNRDAAELLLDASNACG
jgi:hypothetical protein